MRICKFNGNVTASVEGIRYVAEFIHNNEPKVVILSATEDIKKQLSEIANNLFASDIEGAHNKITRLEFQYLDLVNQLLSDEIIKRQAVRHIINCFQTIWEYCRKPFLKINKNKIMEQGEILTCSIMGIYLQEKNVNNIILFASDFMRTKRNGEIDMKQTSLLLTKLFKSYPEKYIFVIQHYTNSFVQTNENKIKNKSVNLLKCISPFPTIFRSMLRQKEE